ncbi:MULTISPECIES: hypothetical protein [Rhodomicrobium]|uniref:hypothetical protein n=1 Tax=Rhodomicrobium TaxID=1068 RepID=UPI000B4BC7BA|nr:MULTISPECIES: hypothetical protein [Rhodomicrobium]
MQKLQDLAWVSVARGCGFAALGIVTLMFAMSGHLASAFKSGGILTLITSLVLQFRGWQAPKIPYKRTELWLMLEPQHRPDDALAQTVIGETLKRTYLGFALHSALLASCLFALSLVLGLFG